jgi:phosphoglycolate phosphatase-like HAD superfamily hydrolase
VYLALFDIDGTLIRSQGVGGLAMERAGRKVLGPAFSLKGIDFGGALDPWIYQEAALRMGRHDAHALHEDFRAAYLAELALALDGAERLPIAIPGVEVALGGLAARTNTTLGLVTGNYAHAAPLKLRAAGIDPAQFVLGAYGGDAPTRPDLVRLAMEQWRARGAEPDPRRVVVIGDTPRDVDCAKKNGCRCVAVATGWHTAEQLRETEADAVVDDLRGLCELLERMWTT